MTKIEFPVSSLDEEGFGVFCSSLYSVLLGCLPTVAVDQFAFDWHHSVWLLFSLVCFIENYS